VRKNNFSNSFGNDQECLFFQGSVCYRPGTIAEVIFAHCLSDLHFAKARRGEHVWWYPGEAKKNNSSLADVVGRATRDSNIGIVIISGDFTFAASHDEFDEAYKSINAILGTLGLGPDNLVVIPGNHDIAWTRAKGDAYDPSLRVDTAPEEAKKAYANFYRRLMKHEANEDFSMGRRFLLPGGVVVEVCALNSSSLEQGEKYLAGMGMVRPNVFDDVREQLGWNESEPSLAFRVLVLHHHLGSAQK